MRSLHFHNWVSKTTTLMRDRLEPRRTLTSRKAFTRTQSRELYVFSSIAALFIEYSINAASVVGTRRFEDVWRRHFRLRLRWRHWKAIHQYVPTPEIDTLQMAKSSRFAAEGAIGGAAQKVGGPFDAQGSIGKQFTDKGSIGGTVQEHLGQGESNSIRK